MKNDSSFFTCHRSGAVNVTTGVNKLDSTLSPAGSNARATIKIEQDKSTLSRDVTAGLNKERLLTKGGIKYVLTIFLLSYFYPPNYFLV